MATPLSASRMVAALKAEGVRVREHRNWRNHNRNHKGAWGPVNGVMIHHTVSSGTSGSVNLCYNGHSTLPGPLCHAVGAKDGSIYLVGNGRANHAGLGDDNVLRAVIAERSVPHDNEANTDGNARFYGLEIINLGNGRDTYPREQYDAAVRWAAAICRAHGWGARSVIGHREWQPGKIDPHGPVEGRGNFDMDEFRRDVAQRLAGSASAGGTVAISDKDAEKIAKAFAKLDVFEVPWESDNKHNQFKNAIASMWRQTYRSEQKIDELLAKVDSLDLDGFKAALESLTIGLDVE